MLEVFILAVALSMDAFAVSIGLGTRHQENLKSLALKAGLFFGIFQAIMPLIGYLGGLGLKEFIDQYDHIVAFLLLVAIGAKMIYEALHENIEEHISQVTNKILLTLAIATSIDAIAAGFSLNQFDTNIFISILTIGLTTFVFSYIGVFLGSRGGEKHESKAEILGGVVLILIGFKILIF